MAGCIQTPSCPFLTELSRTVRPPSFPESCHLWGLRPSQPYLA